MVEAGRIRAGDKGDKGQPQRIDKWRLTSKDRVRLAGAAALWGGEVREWKDRPGEFELYTDTDALPIMLLPEQVPTTWYEMWSKGGCQRRCDGQHELISDSACLCGEERECKPYTRLSVLLPDLPGIGSWMLSSTGWNAAAELAGAADLLQRASAQGVLIPARLRLEQRVQVQSGQTRRFAVPVIDLDVSFRELLGGSMALTAPAQVALPSGYTPLTGNGGNGVSLEEGLAAAEQSTTVRTARSAAPIPSLDDDIPFGTGPVPVPDESGATTPSAAPGNTVADLSNELEDHRAALNALVGQLREAGIINTRQLWARMARMRGVKVDEMIDLLNGFGTDGELHWTPLRDSLDLAEATELRKRLGRLWAEEQAKVPA